MRKLLILFLHQKMLPPPRSAMAPHTTQRNKRTTASYGRFMVGKSRLIAVVRERYDCHGRLLRGTTCPNHRGYAL